MLSASMAQSIGAAAISRIDWEKWVFLSLGIGFCGKISCLIPPRGILE